MTCQFSPQLPPLSGPRCCNNPNAPLPTCPVPPKHILLRPSIAAAFKRTVSCLCLVSGVALLISRLSRQISGQTKSRPERIREKREMRPIGLSLKPTGMIYDGRSVACSKLIIGNARVVLQVVQDTLSLALQIPEKPGWPATSRFLWFLMLMSLLSLVWQGPRHKPASDRTKNEKGR